MLIYDTFKERAFGASTRCLLTVCSLLATQCNWSVRECTAMGVYDMATVHFAPPISGSGSWCFEVETSGPHCVTCVRVTDVPRSGSDAGNVVVPPTIPDALTSLPYCADLDGVGRFDFSVSLEGDAVAGTSNDLNVHTLLVASQKNLQSLLPSLKYRAYLDGDLRYEREVQFSYQSSEPNGSGCGVVHAAEVTTAP